MIELDTSFLTGVYQHESHVWKFVVSLLWPSVNACGNAKGVPGITLLFLLCTLSLIFFLLQSLLSVISLIWNWLVVWVSFFTLSLECLLTYGLFFLFAWIAILNVEKSLPLCLDHVIIVLCMVVMSSTIHIPLCRWTSKCLQDLMLMKNQVKFKHLLKTNK